MLIKMGDTNLLSCINLFIDVELQGYSLEADNWVYLVLSFARATQENEWDQQWKFTRE